MVCLGSVLCPIDHPWGICTLNTGTKKPSAWPWPMDTRSYAHQRELYAQHHNGILEVLIIILLWGIHFIRGSFLETAFLLGCILFYSKYKEAQCLAMEARSYAHHQMGWVIGDHIIQRVAKNFYTNSSTNACSCYGKVNFYPQNYMLTFIHQLCFCIVAYKNFSSTYCALHVYYVLQQ